MRTNLNKIIALGLLAIMAGINGCIEEFGGTGDPFARSEQVAGTWTVSKVVQRDLLAENPLYQTLEVTEIFDFDQYKLTINADGSFSVSNTGDAPDFIITAGTWSLDDPKFPTAIILSNDGSESSRLDFGSLNSLTENNQLQVNYTRTVLIPKEETGTETDVERQTVAYEYTLSRSN
jgi:hypothetical protein